MARDRDLLLELLAAEDEDAVLTVLKERRLLDSPDRWENVGGLPNNQSIINNQQSTPAAALTEKFTNAIDAILLRHCKGRKIDPRSVEAPRSMDDAVLAFLGDLSSKGEDEIRRFAEENLLIYATGSKSRPCLSLYDAGEGQLPEHFPNTFCSLISGETGKSYKGAIPFVQGRFNMGGTGVLPYCSDKRRLQLIVSRVPTDVAGGNSHEWAFTLFCFFPSKQDPSWKYLLGDDGQILTAGPETLALVPKSGARSGEVCRAREREVDCGTLIKMYDYKAPRSNICGELFRKLTEYLIAPALPIRIIECRGDYKAKVMQVTIWNRFADWRSKGLLEPGFEDGASVSLSLSTGDTLPGEIRVFKEYRTDNDGQKKPVDPPLTGLRALINGQSHARREVVFFKTQKVDKEHIADSMLVTLDCTQLGQDARNALFMSNRETFREDVLLNELLPKLQSVLKSHDELRRLNDSRYKEKVANATTNEEGIKALEDLLSSDPTLADLFGGATLGRVAARTVHHGEQGTTPGKPEPFEGKAFPTFVHRKDGSTEVDVEIPSGDQATASFLTDVENKYFSRWRHRGEWKVTGDAFVTSVRLFNGRTTFTCEADEAIAIGTKLKANISITDNKGSGPFGLTISAVIAPEREREPSQPSTPARSRVPSAPSQPRVIPVHTKAPGDPPITIEKNTENELLELHVNMKSEFLERAIAARSEREKDAVEFVFTYGLALAVMGMLDAVRNTDAWKSDPATCKDGIHRAGYGLARIIVPLSLSLSSKLPKK